MSQLYLYRVNVCLLALTGEAESNSHFFIETSRFDFNDVIGQRLSRSELQGVSPDPSRCGCYDKVNQMAAMQELYNLVVFDLL